MTCVSRTMPWLHSGPKWVAFSGITSASSGQRSTLWTQSVRARLLVLPPLPHLLPLSRCFPRAVSSSRTRTRSNSLPHICSASILLLTGRPLSPTFFSHYAVRYCFFVLSCLSSALDHFTMFELLSAAQTDCRSSGCVWWRRATARSPSTTWRHLWAWRMNRRFSVRALLFAYVRTCEHSTSGTSSFASLYLSIHVRAVCERYCWRVEKVDSMQFACPSPLPILSAPAAQHSSPLQAANANNMPGTGAAVGGEAGSLVRLESQLLSLAEYTAFVESWELIWAPFDVVTTREQLMRSFLFNLHLHLHLWCLLLIHGCVTMLSCLFDFLSISLFSVHVLDVQCIICTLTDL